MENVSCAGWQRSVGTEIQGERVSLVEGTPQAKARRWDGMLGVWRLLKTPDGLLFLFKKKIFFLGRPFLRSLLIVTILVLFYDWGRFFWPRGMWDPSSPTRD